MTGQFQRESPFSYACDHYMDTVYRLAVHNARSTAGGRGGRDPGGL